MRRLFSCMILALATGLAMLSTGSAPAAPPAESPFAVRGIKGLWWDGFANYDQALPWVAAHDMNFLMFCYSSFAESGTDWRKPFGDEDLAHFARLAREANRSGVNLCYSFNPGIWSKPPLTHSSEADYGAAWAKVRSIHGTGIHWIALCLDDISRALTPEDVERFGTLQAAQVYFVNRLWADMKTLSPRPHLIFCPSAYTTGEIKTHADYARAIGEGVDPEVMLFWTGPQVCSPSITVTDAREVAGVYKRKPFVWDNYPVNDMMPWRPLMGPVKNRDPHLAGEVSGFLANTMKQWALNPMPLASFADYFRDPMGYNPGASLDRTLALSPASQRPALTLLADLYGSSFWGEANFPPQPRPADAAHARALLFQYQRLRVMLSENPALRDVWSAARDTLEKDIAAIQARAAE